MALQSSFSSSSSSSSFSNVWSFDVVLSFRGTDTRHGFTGNLYRALRDRGIHTFIDDEELQRGEEITPSLVKAIQESRIAIPVFSTNYASSTFCLDELATIMECVKGTGRLVLPVFYDVDPSDVRHQRGTCGEALAKHEERFKDKKEKVQKWKQVLHQAANLSGWHFKPGNEYEYVFIEKIVKEISSRISRVPLPVVDYPVGLESRVLKVIELLNDESDERVHLVGICGIGGIGKSTLARAVYNLIADQFEYLCFLPEVRENSAKYGLVHLQKTLLSKILREKDIALASVNEGISIIKHRFQKKKLLLVLDDVDTLEQLQVIVGMPNWFGPGSRVIITTRYKHLLAAHGVERKYEVKGLNEKEALELLSWNAFRYAKVDPSYMDILKEVMSYASGIPLALEVIGSNLFGKNVEEWIHALDRLKRGPDKENQMILKISFDGLHEYQKKIFLDIACCLKGYRLKEVEDILHAHHGINPESYIDELVRKALIMIDKDQIVRVHDLIQDMGRKIVHQESPKEPGKRSRLWLLEDVMHVLQENTGSSEIEMIIAEAPISQEVKWDGEAFKNMKRLKTLIVSSYGKFPKGPKHLPNSLRVLKWSDPSHSLPFDVAPKKLAILKLRGNCFIAFQLVKMLKNFVNIRDLDVNWNGMITQIPDVSCVPNIEKLSLAYCENLIEIHESVGYLVKLRILDVKGCRKLRSLPSLMLPSLEDLYLSDCSSLESFPKISGKMENIRELDLYNTCIKELPCSICNLTQLRLLKLGPSPGIPLLLSNGIFMLPELSAFNIVGHECLLSSPNQDQDQLSSVLSSKATHVKLCRCNMSDEFLQIFLPRFPNVQELDLSDSNFTILPACIKHCRSLRLLWLNDCENLQEIRGIPPNIEGLYANHCTSINRSSRGLLLNKKFHEEGGNKTFVFPATRIPRWFEHQSSGESISFWFRNQFPAISLCLLLKEKVVDEYLRLAVLKLIINDNNEFEICKGNNVTYYPGHIYIYDINQVKFKADVDEVLLKSEWNQAVISIRSFETREPKYLFDIEIGMHINEERINMDDIQFTNLLLQKDEYMRQQQRNLASLTDNLSWDSNKKLIYSSSSTTTITVQVLDNQENCPVESFQAPSFAERQDIQLPCPTSSSAILSEEELHLPTCSTVSPPIIDVESLRNKVEQSQDNAEMKSSLDDAGAHVLSNSHDHSAITAPSEEASDAFKKVQHTNDYDVGNHLTVLDHALVEQLPLLKPKEPTSSESVESTENDCLSVPSSLDDVLCCSSNSDSVSQSLVASPLGQPLDDAYNNSDSMQSARAIDRTNVHPKMCIVIFLCLLLIVLSLFGSTMWHWCFHRSYTSTSTELDHAALDHPEKAPRESSQAAGFDKMQNTEAQSSILSSGKISGQKQHLDTMLMPTKIDKSVKNKVEPSQDDDVEMEAFYSSLDADTYVPSGSHNHLATMAAASEEAKEALKIVHDFITNDPSFLLDPKQCSLMKTSLDYLSNLSTNDDGLSGEMRALISEASRMFTHYNSDYIEASKRIESTATELLKADELEADLKDNKNKFKEVVALEKELLQKLMYLEESKKELEKQITAIEANIRASQSEQSMAHEKKRDIFEEGKKLITQMSEFREKAPHLQHEQDLAKEKQAKFNAEWSELGGKFKKIVVG